MTDLKLLATQALKDSERWPTNWCAETTDEDMNYCGLSFFRCWSADGRDGATQEMALGSEDYDDALATYIATLANGTPALARGYLELEAEVARLHVERDAAQATADSWRASALSWQRRESEAIVQRDAARAALTEACDGWEECRPGAFSSSEWPDSAAIGALRTRGGV